MKKIALIMGLLSLVLISPEKNASAATAIEFQYTVTSDTLVTGFIIGIRSGDAIIRQVNVSCPNDVRVAPGPGKRIEGEVDLANHQLANAESDEEAGQIFDDIITRPKAFSGLAPCVHQVKRCTPTECVDETP